MRFVIDRSKWRAGGEGRYAIGLGRVRLLNREKFMCCLGHVSKQIEPEVGICCRGLPSDTKFKSSNILVNMGLNEYGFSFCHNTDLTINAQHINDNPDLTAREREQQLRELHIKSRNP